MKRPSALPRGTTLVSPVTIATSASSAVFFMERIMPASSFQFSLSHVAYFICMMIWLVSSGVGTYLFVKSVINGNLYEMSVRYALFFAPISFAVALVLLIKMIVGDVKKKK
jgi:hypothetical protein